MPTESSASLTDGAPLVKTAVPGRASAAPAPLANPRQGSSTSSPSVAPLPPPSVYYRIAIDGAEDDGGDYTKAAELLAAVIEARLAYKRFDKGQAESFVTVEELNALSIAAPRQKNASTASSAAKSPLLPAPAGNDAVAAAAAAAGSPSSPASPASPLMHLSFDDGVYRVLGMKTDIVPWGQYVAHIQRVYQAIESGPCLTTARSRLTSLTNKFQLYSLMNAELEASSGVCSAGGGAYHRCTKVDNAVHLKTSMTAPALLEFLVRTAREEPATPLLDLAEANAILAAAGLGSVSVAGRAGGGGGSTSSGTSTDDALADGVGSATVRPASGSAVERSRGCASVQQYLQAGGVRDPGVLSIEGLGLHPTLYRNKFLPYNVFDHHLNPAGAFGAKLLQAVLSCDNDGPNRGDLCGAVVRAEMERRESKPRQAVATETMLDVSGINEREVQALAAWVRRQGFNAMGTNMWVLNVVPRVQVGFDREGGAASVTAATALSATGGTPGSTQEVPMGTGTISTTATSTTATTSASTIANASGANNNNNSHHHHHSNNNNNNNNSSGATAASGSATCYHANCTPTCRTVGDQLRNIFYPLFMATLYPSDPQYTDVAQLLANTGAVSIQTSATSRTQNLFTTPAHPDTVKLDHVAAAPSPVGARGQAGRAAATSSNIMNNNTNNNSSSVQGGGGGSGSGKTKDVSDFYMFYYVWANVASLNSLRARLGLNTLNFNPAVQEQAPAYDQLACSFLLADNVRHATSLDKSWVMQFLYLCTRIGLVMSPLRDNALSIAYFDHPIVQYLQQGQRVSLATSDPLHFHHRVDQPLLEEYASLLRLRSLTAMDLCELARNSVLNSNFPAALKCQWLGDRYTEIGCYGNEVARSGVSDARLQFRCEALSREEAVLNRVLGKVAQAKGAATPAPAVTIVAAASNPFFVAGATGQDGATGSSSCRSLGRFSGVYVDVGDDEDRCGATGRRRSRRSGPLRLRSRSRGSLSGRDDSHINRQVAFPRVRIALTSGRCGDAAPTQPVENPLDDKDDGGDSDGDTVPAQVAVFGGARRQRTGYATVGALRQVLLLRKKYVAGEVAADVNVEDVFDPANQMDEDRWEYGSYYGVVLLCRVGQSAVWPSSIPLATEFMRDVETVRQAVSSASLRRLAAHRLQLLERKFQLHLSMNISKESGTRQDKEWDNRDFFTAHKVDTNVCMEAGHNARTLLEFFLEKAMNHGDDVVGEDAEQNPVMLRTLLQHYRVRVETMTVDELHHLLATHEDLRRTFLSPHNYMQGRYFAELTKKTLDRYIEDAYSFAENRLTFQGGAPDEWRQLSHWFDRYGMASSQCRWMISIPRDYSTLRASGAVRDFGEFLDNIFLPLWEISLHPAKDTKLHYFLTHVSGFDCVHTNEELSVDTPMVAVAPHDWNTDASPPYNYYMYYLWANLTTLNEFRASRGLGTFTFRPQCGETGGTDHLIGGFLLASGINHGVTLARHPVLEYMFYLTQIGVAMSPLSNTAAASAYLENPFPVYFQRGLNVSLATNQPLYFHFTREPLIEEYSIASKLWQLEFNDLSEIARNSVLQCGFPPAWKVRALGPLYSLRSTVGNDVTRSRVSDIRVAMRYECYHAELDFLDEQLLQPQSATASMTIPDNRGVGLAMPRAMRPLAEELALAAAVIGPFGAAGRYGSRAGSIFSRSGTPGLAAETRPPSALLTDALGRPLRGSSASDSDDDFDDSGSYASSAYSSGHTPTESERRERRQRRRRRTLLLQQSELDRLEEQMRQLAAVSSQLASENAAVAVMINQLRDRMGNEALAILGGLGSSERAASELEKATGEEEQRQGETAEEAG